MAAESGTDESGVGGDGIIEHGAIEHGTFGDAHAATAPTTTTTTTPVEAAVAVETVWRAESAKIVATLARFTGDVGFAEDLAQDAVADALAQWPGSGIPSNGAAWLTTVGKRKAIDAWRRQERLDTRYGAMARELLAEQIASTPGGGVSSDISQSADAYGSGNGSDSGSSSGSGSYGSGGSGGSGYGAGGYSTTGGTNEWNPDEIDDDVLRLVFVACHPVLSRDAQVCLTLRVVGGLTTEQIARAVLVPVATVQQRIVRAKRILRAAKVPFEVPDRIEFAARLDAVLEVVYLIFNEGYVATSGDGWGRVDVAAEALRLGLLLGQLMPREPEVHALVALMQFQSSRFD
ncbi:MAG: polymerase ECF-type sigma factor, partial [Subtercola sp.]|nr:polymerase ECF-type sigma factor [Subtercola sp.]